MNDEAVVEPEPVHWVLLDHIATTHSNLQMKVFSLLSALFERESRSTEVAEVVIDRQRTVMDRFVHLLSVGAALPVTEFTYKMYLDGQADVSLIRYFATEVLEIVCPPYSQDFVDVFLPIVTDRDIFDRLVKEKVPAAKEFIDACVNSAVISSV